MIIMGKLWEKHQKKILYFLAIVIIILLCLILLFSFEAYKHFSSWEQDHRYLNQESPKIESWMTIGIISQRFSLDTETIVDAIGINVPKVNLQFRPAL